MKCILSLTVILFLFSSCQTVTISDDLYKLGSHPAFSDRQYFFLWGIVPDIKTVNVVDICKGKKVKQLQTLDAFTDQIIRIFTLGLVYPRTVKVWCKK